MRQFILAIFFLCAPARADADVVIYKTPVCSEVPAIALAAPEPLLINIFAARELIREYRADNPRCKMAGRIWHEGKCWLPTRIPRS